MHAAKQNLRYEVLTPTGWANFDAIKVKSVQHYIRLIFTDGSSLGCTENHLIKVGDVFIEAQWLSPGQKIQEKVLQKIDYIYGETQVYDLVNVDKNNEYITSDVISHNCEFMGSSGTLLSARALKSLAFVKPLFDNNEGLHIYENPIQHHRYITVVDTSRGRGLDYSAFITVDVTEMPYKVVCKYRDNEISPLAYPAILKKVGTHYNNSYILVEINDNGQQVSDGLFDDYEYENLISTADINKKIVATWQYGNKSVRGIRTTKSVKRLGCSIMKDLIENQKLTIQDFDIISELSTFVAKGTSYEADEGSHDDLVMCLVLFGWLTNQTFFSDVTNTSIKDKLYKDKMQAIEDETLPLPISSNDPMFDPLDGGFVEGGSLWHVVRP